ncbi:MAG: hypothetical protein sL5_00350 [Candidatus Mesenet longicola]|uniref:Uncharacterized protein n=1 Tax=Candidatus Mesenet longicola TaxID=1892558 RepID=A0A8J3MMC2_9RICK|nr:MAG: hypothetical protein sGL2_00880 [Candidatus Mesenet longicola]GHM59042.1 MAG: hypothetical protein sL5_00350 [Candidatus Mesenet longicola]
MLDNNEEDLSKVLSYQIRIDNTEGIKSAIREGDKPVNRGIPQYRSLANAIYNNCSQASLEALIEGGAEVAKGYGIHTDDLMSLLDLGYQEENCVTYSDNYNFRISSSKIKLLLDNGAKIVYDLSPLQDKIIASIDQCKIDKKFDIFNDFSTDHLKLLEDSRLVSNDNYDQWCTMMEKLSKFQCEHMDDVFNLVKHFFLHRMHNERRDEPERRLWQLHINTLTEKGRVIMLHYTFQKHPQDTTDDRLVSCTYYTTLHHIFQNRNLLEDIERVIDSAQLIIKQKKGSVISNNIQSQAILINESGLHITDTTNIPSLKHTFSTAYKIVTLAAYQIMYHDKKQNNKAKIAGLIEEVIKCGVTKEEIFESFSQFCCDYTREQCITGAIEKGKLPGFDYHKLFEYIKKCISSQQANWQNLPPEIGTKVSEHLNTKDGCQAENANEIAKEGKKNKTEAIRQQIPDTPTTEMEVQIGNLSIAAPSRQ